MGVLGIAVSFYTILGALPIIGFVGWVLNLFLAPIFMRSIFETARCFCVENRTIDEDEGNLHQPVLARDSLISAMFAMVMVLLAVPLCLSGSLLTPAPYVAILRWQAAPAKAPAPKQDGRRRHEPGHERNRQIQEVKNELLGELETPHLMQVMAASVLGAALLYGATMFARGAVSVNTDLHPSPPAEASNPPATDRD